ncbi:hypothetical protein A5893_03205 [Pedobacter psychrophilus]|uniref:Exonuclease domain-containing protein n=1 Tax=Pedobacter psychrophilus TaxID=1826909 RepID=A0A179DM61_9SPHI|nr:3'-5' exonuclease [Pedobacter psychrophilus]OAQ42137.1 hypothetical protein A5893_03205 [Pedobacter psychrophilus]
MKDFYLVVDSETSGLPKKWDLPYSAPNNWPYILQLAWIIFNKNGEEIKRENHYINIKNVKISKASQNVHHLDYNFLTLNGKDRLEVMTRFATDLETYHPLIIGHFVELDFNLICAEFYRENIKNCINELPLYCTMMASKSYIKNPSLKYLKLNRFYKTLFNKRPEILHDAIVDAELTSEIFFHLLKKNEIDDDIIEHQQTLFHIKNKKINPNFKLIGLVLIVILTILISYLAYGK